MTVLTVHRFPDSVLKQKAQPVTRFDAELKKLSANMLETMYLEGGIGLAANQVGQLRRLVVVDLKNGEEDERGKPTRDPHSYVNPEILEAEGELITEEGCLSVTDFRAEVKRAARVRLRYQTLTGETKEEWLEELGAVCVQHEIDHLNGKLFIDRLPLLKREMVKKRLVKLQRAEQEDLRDDVRISLKKTGTGGKKRSTL
jgi:peptide deformylase